MEFDAGAILANLSRLRGLLSSALSVVHSPAESAALLGVRDALDFQALIFSSPPPESAKGGAELAQAERSARLEAAEMEMAGALQGLAQFGPYGFAEDLAQQLDLLRKVIRFGGERFRGGEQTQRGPKGGVARMAASIPGEPPAAQPPAAESPGPALDTVLLGCSSPASVAAGAEFVARFVAYLEQDEPQVRDRIRDAAPGLRPHLPGDGASLLRGAVVQVTLEGSQLSVEEREGQTFVWQGKPVYLPFTVKAAEKLEGKGTVLKFNVLLEGVVIGRLRLEIGFGADTRGAAECMGRKLAKTAFASYASKDRARVLDRVAAIRIAAGMDIFLDCMDLAPSEQWKPRLEKEIEERELFMLFWSVPARRSKWVTWEWTRALKKKGIEGMQVQPLENGVKPPTELRGIHFADRYVGLRRDWLADKKPD